MPAADFPNSPVIGNTWTVAGITWVYIGNDKWEVVPSPPQNFVEIVDEANTVLPERGQLKFIGALVQDDAINDRVLVKRKQETQYRFELITSIDQDLWLYASQITQITKTAGIATATYKINAGSPVSITFSGNTWTGTINVAANDVLTWSITYTGGYTTGALIVVHNRT